MSICALCARTHGSCCIGRDILVTLGDIERIERRIGSSDFYEYRRPADPAYLDQDDDPNWNRYTVQPDGTRRVLRHQAEKRCLFLTDCGCSLDAATRPLICRLYPVCYTEMGITGLDEECTALIRGNRWLEDAGDGRVSDPAILLAIGMNLQGAEQWREQLYRELRGEQPREKRSA